MRVKTLIQLTPHSPPLIDGIGDYARLLKKALENIYGVSSHFVYGDQVAHSSASLVNHFESLPKLHRTILLHYVGYGYETRGCPEWLIEGVQKLKDAGYRIITYFHELEGNGPPWTSAFWLKNRQVRLIKQLAVMSSAIIVSTQLFETTIKGRVNNTNLTMLTLPIISTIGVSELVIDWNSRSSRLAVFGQEKRRNEVYEFLSSHPSYLSQFGIDEIIDIGPQIPIRKISSLNHPVTILGTCSDKEIQAILANSKFGIIQYPASYLAKSSIFAAFCSHGVCPLVIKPLDIGLTYDGLIAGMHYVPLDKRSLLSDQFTVSTNARQWYEDHTLHHAAEQIQRIITEE